MPSEVRDMTGTRNIDEEIVGLDHLERPLMGRPPWTRRFWDSAWPKLAAIGLVLVLWQLIVWSGWKPRYVLPPPVDVLRQLAEDITTRPFWTAVGITMQRAAIGFAAAVFAGSLIGLAVAQSTVLRRAAGSLITGLQSMPSIVWFPFAILLFQISETAIFFVVVLGAAPAIANGLISGIDHIEPILLRAGKMLGARGPYSWLYVILPAALPGYVAGLKQGWAFSWRSLMAGELLVIVISRPSIGVRLSYARELADAEQLQAMMIVVLVIGIIVDGVFFGTIERKVRRNRGLIVS